MISCRSARVVGCILLGAVGCKDAGPGGETLSATAEAASSGESAKPRPIEAGQGVLVRHRHGANEYHRQEVTRVDGSLVYSLHGGVEGGAAKADVGTIWPTGELRRGDDVACHFYADGDAFRMCRVLEKVGDGKCGGPEYRLLEESGRRDRILEAGSLGAPPDSSRKDHKRVMDEANKRTYVPVPTATAKAEATAEPAEVPEDEPLEGYGSAVPSSSARP